MRIPFIFLPALLSLCACTVTPARVTVRAPSIDYPVVVIPHAPPPPRVEVYGAPPGHDYFWLPGYWAWRNNTHFWVDGHWEHNREQEHWVPHRWEHDEHDGWRLHEGYWHHY